MSALPIMLEGSRFTALVVGGGSVALRKAHALIDAGVRVTLVAPRVDAGIVELASRDARLTVIRSTYEASHIGDASMVIAATDDAAVNATVAADAFRMARLVNVVDDPEAGNFVTPAVHRAGDLTVAVSAGRVPAAAAAIRDAIAARFDDRYGSAIAELRRLRDRLLADGGRDKWKAISADVLGDGFCESVENDSIEAKVAAWR